MLDLGRFPYINADGSKIEVDGKLYVIDDNTVLRNEVGVIEYDGKDVIKPVLKENETQVFDIEVKDTNIITSFKYRAADDDRKAAKKVVDMIDALGSNPAKADVEAARAAFGTTVGTGGTVTTTKVQQNLVTNLAKLEAAEKKIADAAAEADLQAAVDAVKTQADAGTLATTHLDAVTGLTYTAANIDDYETAIAAKAAADVNTVTKLQAVIDAVDADVVKAAEVDKYTNATDATAMRTLLDNAAKGGDDNPLNLDMSAFKALTTEVEKQNVADQMFAKKATLTSVEEIQAAINLYSK
nr:MAG TPA: hypothetical protein [Caudoviricetes sp.]